MFIKNKNKNGRMTCSQLLVDAGCANGLSLGGFWCVHGHCQSYNAKFAVKLTCRRSAELLSGRDWSFVFLIQTFSIFL